MSQATDTHTTPTRRRALFAAAAIAVTTIAAPALTSINPNPDAELIALCGQFDALEHRINSFYDQGATPIEDDKEREAAQSPLFDQQEPLIDRICMIQATTTAGMVARARSLALWAPDLLSGGTTDQRLVAALLRDLLGEAA